VVNRHFQLRTCTDHVLHNRRRPCLQYQIKRCPAPCVMPVARDDYGEQVRDVRLFLEGKSDELFDRLRGRMREAAGRTEFERAALVRDQLRALESTLEAQRVVSSDFFDQDVIGFHRDGIALEIVVIAIREGKMAGSRAFSFTDQEFPDAEILSSFLGLYYDLTPAVPDEVLLPFAIADAELKADWLSEIRATLAGGPGGPARRRRVELLVPQRGPRRDLAELARKNAAASFASRRNAQHDAEAMLAKLQKRLRLPRTPRVIECYDISHVQGSDTVASMVVFVDGKPEKTRYRTFKLQRGGRGSPDDFASMYEVLSRRFRRARQLAEAAEATAASRAERIAAGGGAEGLKDDRVGEIMAEVNGSDSPWQLPDLLVVDGGKGQLGMALAAARDVGIDIRAGVGLPIIALAKERDAAEPAALVDDETESDDPFDNDRQRLAGVAPEPLDSTDPGVADTRPAATTPTPMTTAPAATTTGPSAPSPPPAPTAAVPPGGAASYTPSSSRAGAKAPATRNPDRVFLAHAKDAIPIRANSAEMFVLAHLRDEAHRFAVTFHRAQRKRRTLRSSLSDIPGIGETRQRELLRQFGSVRKIREAALEDLAAVPGMGPKAAQAVRDHFDAHPEPAPAVMPRRRAVHLPMLEDQAADPAIDEAVALDEATDADAPLDTTAEEEAVLAAFAATDDEPESD
jgi:excinuclease ABC subunit C